MLRVLVYDFFGSFTEGDGVIVHVVHVANGNACKLAKNAAMAEAEHGSVHMVKVLVEIFDKEDLLVGV